MALAEEIMDLETRQWESLRSAGDAAAFYAEHLRDDAVIAVPAGILDRPTLLREVVNSPVITNYEIRDPRVISLGEDSAVAVYKATQWRKGMDPFDSAISTVYVRGGDRWYLTYHQMTPLEADAPF